MKIPDTPKTIKQTLQRLETDKKFYNSMKEVFGTKKNLDEAIEKWKYDLLKEDVYKYIKQAATTELAVILKLIKDRNIFDIQYSLKDKKMQQLINNMFR